MKIHVGSEFWQTLTCVLINGPQGVGDYEAAFSDDEEVMDATDQRSKTKSPIHGIVDSDVGAVSMDNGEQGSSDDNTIKINEGATSPPPKSPVSDAKYYFFYQGTVPPNNTAILYWYTRISVSSLSLPSSRGMFSQPEKCISEIVRIGSIIIFYLRKL